MTEIGKVEISLNEYKDMQNEASRLNDKIASLQVEKGSLISDIKRLQDKLDDPDIRISVNAPITDPWGSFTRHRGDISTIKVNSEEAKAIMNDVKAIELNKKISDLEKELNLKSDQYDFVSSQLKVLQDTLKSKERDLKDTWNIKLSELSSDYNNKRKQIELDYSNLTSNKEFEYKEKFNSLIERERDYEKEIESLQEELEKERSNKTDRELEEKRIQEIATLNSRVVELEGEIERLKSMNIFTRAWEFFTKRLAQKEAIKELERSKEAVEKVISKPNVYWFSHPW